jgi:hypothetical protein
MGRGWAIIEGGNRGNVLMKSAGAMSYGDLNEIFVVDVGALPIDEYFILTFTDGMYLSRCGSKMVMLLSWSITVVIRKNCRDNRAIRAA